MNLTTIFFLSYLVLLTCIGFWGNKHNKKGSISDYFLASGKVGLIPLFFTCYASVYSGETFLGVSGAGYSQGFIMISFIAVMLAVIMSFWIIAPKIKQLADKYKFITAGDFIDNRYSYKPLRHLANIGFCIAITLYILGNFKAIGYIINHTFEGIFSFNQTVIIIAVIMTLYECLGGMKSVILTDIIQGALMLAGTLLIVVVLFYNYDFFELMKQTKGNRPDFFEIPSWEDLLSKLSLIILAFFSGIFFPHIIQRIYCAKDTDTLRKMTISLSFTPFVSTLMVLILGIAAVALFPNLENKESAILNIVSHLSEGNILLSIFSSLFFVSILAAIMSTVDSASLSASSIIVSDFIDDKNTMGEKKLIFFSRLSIVILMLIVVICTISWEESIFSILQHKLSILAQLAPTFFLGIRKNRPSGKALFYGAMTGLILVISVHIWREFYNVTEKLFYFHDALYFLLINVLVVYVVSKLNKK